MTTASFCPAKRVPVRSRLAMATPAAPSITSPLSLYTNRIAAAISSSLTVSHSSTNCLHGSNVIVCGSIPPAVPSERVDKLSISTIRPACTEASITAERAGWQPTTHRSQADCCRYPAMPLIRPPPPTATNTASRAGSWRSSSMAIVPWPAIMRASL